MNNTSFFNGYIIFYSPKILNFVEVKMPSQLPRQLRESELQNNEQRQRR